MHDESTRALYDFYPPQDKNDFFPAYLYLRYPEHFIYRANLILGLPAQEPAEKVDEGTMQMMNGYIQQFAETVPLAETSTLHGRC